MKKADRIKGKYNEYVFFQPNEKDKSCKVGDCQVRALCKTLNLTWLEVFDLTIPICRELQTYSIFACDLRKTKDAMYKLGFIYNTIDVKTRGSKRPTVRQFAQEHTKGRYVLSLANHVVAVVDGKYYDTWDSGDCCLYGYYIYRGK